MLAGENIIFNPAEKRLRSFWRVTIQFGLFFVAYLLPVYFLDNFENPFTQNLFDEIATLVFVLFSIWVATRFLDKRPFSSIGFRFGKYWFISLLEGMLLGAAVFLVVFLIELGMNWISIDSVLTVDSPFEFTIKLIGRLVGFFAVALMEESFSRGYQIKNISEGLFKGKGTEKKSVIVALIFSSLVFSLMHSANPNVSGLALFNLLIIGLFYGYAFIATGSLAMPLGIHTTWNFMQGNIFGFPVSGLVPEISVFNLSENGPEIFTGGSFGPEAGLIIIIAVIVGILGLNLLINKNPFKFSLDKSLAYYK